MKTRFGFAALAISLFSAWPAPCEEPVFCTFGADKLYFPQKISLITPAENPQFFSRWHHELEIQAKFGERYPFRPDVQLAHLSVGPKPISARDQKGAAWCLTWDNIGYFLNPSLNAKQCEGVVSIFHRDWNRRLTGPQLRQVLNAVETSGRRLGFKICFDRFDEQLMTGVPVQKDGVWLVNFAIIEGTRDAIVEYKYAINRKNQVAMLTRPILQSPFGEPFSSRSSFDQRLGNWRPSDSVSQGFTVWLPRIPSEEFVREATAFYSEPANFGKPLAWTMFAPIAQGPRVSANPSVADVRKALTDENPNIRWTAIESVESLGAKTGELGLDLVNVAIYDQEPVIRDAAACKLKTVVTDWPIVISILQKALASDDRMIVQATCFALSECGEHAKVAIPEIGEALRRRPLGNLIDWTPIAKLGTAILPELRKHVSADKPTDSLGPEGNILLNLPISKADLPIFLSCLGDEKADVRAAAAWAISKLGPSAESAIPALKLAAADPDPFVRLGGFVALTAIAPNNGEVLTLVVTGLNDPEPIARTGVACGLANLDPSREAVATCMRKALGDPDQGVVFAAMGSARQLGAKAGPAIPKLKEILVADKPALRAAAANTLGKIGRVAKTAIPDLIKLLSDDDNEVRRAAAQALQAIDR